MGGGSRKSYATLYIGGVAHCIYLTEGGWSFWPPNIEILRNMFMVPYAGCTVCSCTYVLYVRTITARKPKTFRAQIR